MPRREDSRYQPPMLACRAWAEGRRLHFMKPFSQIRGDLDVVLKTVEGECERRDGAAVQAGANDWIGIRGCRVEQRGLPPPDLVHGVGEELNEPGVADVFGREVLAERVMGESVETVFPLDHETIADHVSNELLCRDTCGSRSRPWLT